VAGTRAKTDIHGQMSFDLITVGDLTADLIMPIPELPARANQHQTSRGFWLELGGSGNVLVAAARLGLRTKAVGAVGDDLYGVHISQWLRENGTDVSDVTVITGTSTPICLTLVDDQGEHVFLGIEGSAPGLPSPEGWQGCLSGTRALYLNGYAWSPGAAAELLRSLRRSRRAGAAVFLDPGPRVSAIDPRWLNEALAETTCLQLTVQEAAALVGAASPSEAAHELLLRGPELVAMKMGQDGSLIATAAEQVLTPAFGVPVRDTTGAGDAFIAACVFGYMRGYTLQQMGWLANAYGAAACTVLGAGRSLPSCREVTHILRGAGIELPHLSAHCAAPEEIVSGTAL
jgi:ribokinase